MSDNGQDTKLAFFNWLPTQGTMGKILHNLMNVTTEVIDTEGNIAGKIEENIFLGDTKLIVIDPTFFIGTEYYEWAINTHEKAVLRVSNILFGSLRLGRNLLSMFVTFLGLPVP